MGEVSTLAMAIKGNCLSNSGSKIGFRSPSQQFLGFGRGEGILPGVSGTIGTVFDGNAGFEKSFN